MLAPGSASFLSAVGARAWGHEPPAPMTAWNTSQGGCVEDCCLEWADAKGRLHGTYSSATAQIPGLYTSHR